MTARDMCTDIATLLTPLPTSHDGSEESGEAGTESILEDREELAESLRNSWSYGDVDPLLSALANIRRQRLRLEAEMRLLVAYGRRFTHPRPYKLIDLANAAGMSISGVRTAYETEEVEQVAELLGRAPTRETADSRSSTGSDS